MQTLTIYLLREDVETAEEAIVGNPTKHDIAEGLSVYGTLYVQSRPSKAPKWADFFSDYVDRKNLGRVQSSAAVFIVAANDRLFALTFGSGRHILRADAYEERFGLLVTLNLVKSDALRSLDKRSFVDDQNSRVQTSQAAAALEFGVNIERDLIRGIVGYPDVPNVGRRLAGADALTVTVDTKIPNLKSMLRKYLSAFHSKEYQAKFPWVDKVRQLHPKGSAVEKLNYLLVDRLKQAWSQNGIADQCWLSIPDVVDWSAIHGFKFTRSKKEGVSTDLHLPGLVQAYPNEIPSIEFLRRHRAMAVNEEEESVLEWPVYRCIQCELDDDGKSYVLSAGHWFEIDKDFETSVDNFVKAIPPFDQTLLQYNHADEGAYNAALAASNVDQWCLMDKKLLKVGDIYDKVEFCDVYGDHALLHIKHYGSSSVLGHLFNQGLVSGELLKSHKDYVALANAKLSAKNQISNSEIPRDVSAYRVVFGVISQSQKPDLHLPFFAKVTLKNVCSRLLDLGYGKVMLSKINCDQSVHIKKLKPGKTKKLV